MCGGKRGGGGGWGAYILPAPYRGPAAGPCGGGGGKGNIDYAASVASGPGVVTGLGVLKVVLGVGVVAYAAYHSFFKKISGAASSAYHSTLSLAGHGAWSWALGNHLFSLYVGLIPLASQEHRVPLRTR